MELMFVRPAWLAFAILVAQCAVAQIPDTALRLDLRPTVLFQTRAQPTFRWYDPLGRRSTVGLLSNLENGFRAVVSQRIERIPNDPDADQLDEYYVEDPGFWRVGKQTLPFGSRMLIRENVPAIRFDTRLLSNSEVDLSLAVCKTGDRLTRGFVARVGSRVGISVMIGRQFTIDASSLIPVRLPEQTPGRGRGYKLVAGFDASQRIGDVILELEVAALRRGETVQDADEDVSDFRVNVRPPVRNTRILFGWGATWRHRRDFFRLEAETPVVKNISLVPVLRAERGSIQSLALETRIRL